MNSSMRPSIYDVPHKYRLLGGNYKYNAGCTTCINCDEELSIFTTFIGFAEYNNGLMQVHECKKCFTQQYFYVVTKEYLNWIIHNIR